MQSINNNKNNKNKKIKVRPQVMKQLRALANRQANTQSLRRKKPSRRETRVQFRNSLYLTSLLNPELTNNAKIPGSAVPVVSLHRRIIQRYTTNSSGCIGINFTPESCLHENTINTVAYNYVPIRVCNVTSYSGTVAPAVGDFVTQTATNTFSLPEGTCKQYRVVSACITVRSLASALNRSGDIHIALVNGQYQQSNSAAASTDEVNFLALSNIDNLVQGKYAYARVENGQSARAIWIPQDVSCLDFKDINLNPVMTDNFITIIGIGLAASSSVEIVADFNFEVTAKVGSMLQGMESFCNENIDPLRIWRSAYSLRPPCFAAKDLAAHWSSPGAITPLGVLSGYDANIDMQAATKALNFMESSHQQNLRNEMHALDEEKADLRRRRR